MKNKFKFAIYFLIISLFNFENLHSEKITYLGDNIKILEEGNTVIGDGNIQIQISNNINIFADNFKYNKKSGVFYFLNKIFFKDTLNQTEASSSEIIFNEKTEILELNNNVKFKDNLNKIKILSDKIEYSKKESFEISNNVKIIDDLNNLEINGSKFFYSKKNNNDSNKSTNIIFDKNYNLISKLEHYITNKKGQIIL